MKHSVKIMPVSRLYPLFSLEVGIVHLGYNEINKKGIQYHACLCLIDTIAKCIMGNIKIPLMCHGLFGGHVLLSMVMYAIIAPNEMNECSCVSIIYDPTNIPIGQIYVAC